VLKDVTRNVHDDDNCRVIYIATIFLYRVMAVSPKPYLKTQNKGVIFFLTFHSLNLFHLHAVEKRIFHETLPF
jgi:hypothetical protein